VVKRDAFWGQGELIRDDLPSATTTSTVTPLGSLEFIMDRPATDEGSQVRCEVSAGRFLAASPVPFHQRCTIAMKRLRIVTLGIWHGATENGP
jgi:hypothetical protein